MKNVILLASILLNIFLLFVKSGDAIKTPTWPVKIVMFGNSLTHGGDWQALLKRTDVQNSGFPGITTYGLLHNINAVTSYHPKICFIEGGINDIHAGAPVDTIFKNLKRIIDTLITLKITPVMQLTFYTSDPNANRVVDTLNAKVKDYAVTRKVKVIDMTSELSTNGAIKPDLTTDGVHLKKDAYVLWAQQVNSILKNDVR